MLASSASVNTLAHTDDAARRRAGPHPQPRLSRSEENLIDLDGANPLYELVNGRSDSGDVFEDWDRSFGEHPEEPARAPVIPPPRRVRRDRESDSFQSTASTSTVHKSQNHSQSLGELLELDNPAPSKPGLGADDLSLLSEYGLGTYFSNMNLNNMTTNSNANAKGNWTTFE